MRNSNFLLKTISTAILGGSLLSGCAADEATIAPPMPIPLAEAQGYAQQKQKGVNVTRQFVGMWQSAKHHMANSLANCIDVSNANGGSTKSCWERLNQQASGYANQFSGVYASGLQPAQQQHFAMARQSAVTYFQLLQSYSKQCIENTAACISPNNPTKYAMKIAKARVNALLGGTKNASPDSAFESGQINDNLSSLSNSPSAVAPSAQVPTLQQKH